MSANQHFHRLLVTGTPVASADHDTRAVFGDYIHVDDVQQSKEDGATVAIYDESRLAKLSLNAADLALMDDENWAAPAH